MSTEEKRAKWREQYKVRKDYLAKVKREARLKNLEEAREKERLKKKKQREKRSEEINAKQREYYHTDAEGAAKQLTRRHKREPYRAIRAAEKLYNEGSIGLSECIERIDKALARADEIIAEAAGKRNEES